MGHAMFFGPGGLNHGPCRSPFARLVRFENWKVEGHLQTGVLVRKVGEVVPKGVVHWCLGW